MKSGFWRPVGIFGSGCDSSPGWQWKRGGELAYRTTEYGDTRTSIPERAKLLEVYYISMLITFKRKRERFEKDWKLVRAYEVRPCVRARTYITFRRFE